MNLERWLYRGGRPNWLASVINRGTAAVFGLGIAPKYLVTLEVRGRRSGRTNSLPLVMVFMKGDRYLVSMLGTNADWVQNVKAAGGDAILVHGRREEVHLEEIAPDQRALLLKAYLKRAPGARLICQFTRMRRSLNSSGYLHSFQCSVSNRGPRPDQRQTQPLWRKMASCARQPQPVGSRSRQSLG